MGTSLSAVRAMVIAANVAMQRSNGNELLTQKNFESTTANGAVKIGTKRTHEKLGASNKYVTKYAAAAQLNSAMRCIKARIAKG